jgi:hypothetical protein
MAKLSLKKWENFRNCPNWKKSHVKWERFINRETWYDWSHASLQGEPTLITANKNHR